MGDASLSEVLKDTRCGNELTKILAILFFNKRYLEKYVMTVAEIRDCLRRSHVHNWRQINIASRLSELRHLRGFSGDGHKTIRIVTALVDSPGCKGGFRLWHLTEAGERYSRALVEEDDDEELLDSFDTEALDSVVEEVSDPVVRSYVQEAITCLRNEALRAAIVFLWAGAIRTLQQKAFDKGITQLNQAISKHDVRAHPVNKLEDFSYICLLYTSPSPRDLSTYRMPSSA